MQIGYIGLGKMGRNMVERLAEKGHDVFAYDVSEEARELAEQSGAKTFDFIEGLIESLEVTRIVWLMVPHGVVDEVLEGLLGKLSEGDTVIDGGNSFYKDSMRRARKLKEHGVKFLDVGVSGGPNGARSGSCLMVGGDRKDYDNLEPLFRDLALLEGFRYMGRHGAGHFVKMIHNGIEYGIMQAIAEGFSVMEHSEFDLDLNNIAGLYNHGSVVESRLVGWLRDAFEEFGQEMEGVAGSVARSGEGDWTVSTAKELGIPVKIIEESLKFRIDSENKPSYTGKLLSAMRNQFGGHSSG